MNQHHPYGGYSSSPARPDREAMRPPMPYGGEQYSATPQMHYPSSAHPLPYGMPPGTHEYGSTPAREYREAPSYPPGPAGAPNYRPPGVMPSDAITPLPLGTGTLRGSNAAASAPYGAPMPYEQMIPPPSGSPAGSGNYGPPAGGAPYSYVDSYGRPPDREFGPPSNERGHAHDFGQRKRSRVEEDPPNEDAVLKDRLKRERPCRTLFVRNIDFHADMKELRQRFEQFGEVKSFFDLVEKRGLAFISFFDLRAAEAAKYGVQGTTLNGRDLDVHYSLPKEAETAKRCDRDKDQGTLFLVLKRAPHDLSDAELHNLFSPFGEIKNLRRYKDQGNCRFLEYWDCRAAKAAHDAIINTTYRGGTWDIKFAWDTAAPDRASEPTKRENERQRGRGGRGKQEPRHVDSQSGQYGYGRDNPYPSAPRDGGYGPPPRDNGYNARPPTYAGGPPPVASGGNSYGVKRPYDYDDTGPSPDHAPRRWGQGSPQAYDNNAPRRYGESVQPYGPGSRDFRPLPPGPAAGPGHYGPPSGPSDYSWRPSAPQQPTAHIPPAASPSVPQRPPSMGGDDRLEQAHKVQQLLASLKPGGNASTGAPAGTPPSANTTPAAGNAAPSLPSNIAALLQMAQSNSANKN